MITRPQMIKYVEGNIIDLAYAGEFNILIHGCNCQKIMGGGLAKEIKTRCPEAFEADRLSVLTVNERLGSFTYASHDNQFTVANAYIQTRPRTHAGERMVNYEALYTSLEKIKNHFSGLKFGIPQIGCGLAGGSWNVVKAMIEEIFKDEDVTIVMFK